MRPFWYNEQANQKKVCCMSCGNLSYNMLAGLFFCSKTKNVIPTKEPEDKHICKYFKSK